MLNNKFNWLLCAAFLMGFNSCSDQLEIVDPNRLSSGQYYSNQSQAVTAVDAIYNALITDGMYMRITPVWNDSRSDEISSRSPWAFFTGVASFTIPPTFVELEIPYAGHYIMITRANQALENVPDVEEVDGELRERLLGQAYFLRGLAYFNLANLYQKVPLILETPAGIESFYPSNENVTMEMLYEQVVSDLNNAISRLPVTYANVSGPDQGQRGRATLGAAQALLGRLYMYQGDYDSAQPLFESVINSGQYRLADNYADLFTQDPGIENSNPEPIFWADFTTSAGAVENWGGDPNVNWRQFIALTPTYSAGDFFDFFPTRFLYDEMREERTVDGRLDPRYHATILSYEPEDGFTTAYGVDWFQRGFEEDAYFIKKYTNAVGGTDAFTAGFDYHVIRYADVLLMYAECLAQDGNIGAAAGIIQEIRDRANLPDRESEFADYSTDEFMEQLEHERIMELAIEGSRWYDLKRWGKLQGAELEELRSHDFELNTFVPNEDEFVPIPQTEIDRNPNLVGNTAN